MYDFVASSFFVASLLAFAQEILSVLVASYFGFVLEKIFALVTVAAAEPSFVASSSSSAASLIAFVLGSSLDLVLAELASASAFELVVAVEFAVKCVEVSGVHLTILEVG